MNRTDQRIFGLINRDADLPPLLDAVAAAERVAMDTESNSLYRYRQRVCLMQFTIAGRDWIVDPLAGMDLRPLLEALAGKTLIFHNADYDLRILRMDLGFAPTGPVFDTMLAAQLLGYSAPGLVKLVKQILGIELNKHGQKSDWTSRPLRPSQLAYARNDTHHLEALADRLEAELHARGRFEWHREWCERMVQTVAADPSPPAREPWRIRGTTHLEPSQLVFVRALWEWREREASRSDRPFFKILMDSTLLRLALWAATQPTIPENIPIPLPRNCVGERLERLVGALKSARATPPEKWPPAYTHPRRPALDPGTRWLVERFVEAVAAVAGRLGLPAGVVAPRATLVLLARHRAATVEAMLACSPIMRWQAELIAPVIRPILEGHPPGREDDGHDSPDTAESP